MIDPEKARKAAAREATLKMMGLFILLERQGGRVRFTDDEYEAMLARYGGSTRIAVRFEVSREDGQHYVELTLIAKPPANSELIS